MTTYLKFHHGEPSHSTLAVHLTVTEDATGEEFTTNLMNETKVNLDKLALTYSRRYTLTLTSIGFDEQKSDPVSVSYYCNVRRPPPPPENLVIVSE